ncbi:hypothetical protein [Actinomadura luteofluorescens]
MRVLSLDCWWPNPDVDFYRFGAPESIFDYDVVIWDPVNAIETYDVQPFQATFQGLRQLSEDESPRLMSDLSRRKQEFRQFVEMGRALIILMAPEVMVNVFTGERNISGTGKNQKVVHLTKKTDLMKALPISGNLFPGVGVEITAQDPGFGKLLRKYRDRWCYRAILEDFPGQSLATVKGTSKAVAAVAYTKSGGMILMLPDLVSPDADGESEDEAPKPDQALVDLLAWVKELHTPSEELPDWAKEFKFEEDITRSQEIAELEERRNELLLQIDQKRKEQAESDDWKLLVTAQGATLEKQVALAFQILGFHVTEGQDRRKDLHLEWNGKKVVVEVKGVAKSASEKNAAQLEKWVSEETISTGVTPKGLLVVNAWKDLPLLERSDPAFPDQMLPFCHNRDHCLMTGMQLLGMVRDCLIDPGKSEAICESILTTVGVIRGWDDPTRTFAITGKRAIAETRATVSES